MNNMLFDQLTETIIGNIKLPGIDLVLYRTSDKMYSYIVRSSCHTVILWVSYAKIGFIVWQIYENGWVGGMSVCELCYPSVVELVSDDIIKRLSDIYGI